MVVPVLERVAGADAQRVDVNLSLQGLLGLGAFVVEAVIVGGLVGPVAEVEAEDEVVGGGAEVAGAVGAAVGELVGGGLTSEPEGEGGDDEEGGEGGQGVEEEVAGAAGHAGDCSGAMIGGLGGAKPQATASRFGD